jgi:hypothetical protein
MWPPTHEHDRFSEFMLGTLAGQKGKDLDVGVSFQTAVHSGGSIT